MSLTEEAIKQEEYQKLGETFLEEHSGSGYHINLKMGFGAFNKSLPWGHAPCHVVGFGIVGAGGPDFYIGCKLVSKTTWHFLEMLDAGSYQVFDQRVSLADIFSSFTLDRMFQEASLTRVSENNPAFTSWIGFLVHLSKVKTIKAD